MIFAHCAAGAPRTDLKFLYDQHRWFDLRAAINGQPASLLYKGSVALAFNDTLKAEQYLQQAAKDPNPADAEQADEALAALYAFHGKYREAVQELDSALKIKPSDENNENSRALFAAWAVNPDQVVQNAGADSIQAKVNKDGIVLPLAIHGQTVHWLLDTGASFSVMSESEAARLGVRIEESSFKVGDSNGGATRMRTAVVDDLTIGRTRLRNVAFLVLPDSQEPMSDWQPGERGIIGIPVALALQSISWTSDGTFRIAPADDRTDHAPSNLALDDLRVIAQVDFQGKRLDCVLDTGAQAGSQLWSRFAAEFRSLLKQHGIRDNVRVSQIGGSNQRTTISLPKVRLRVGGLNTTLRPAQVFPKPVGDDFHHGLLGMDVLSQANTVRIDFTSMRLTLVRLR